MLERVPQVAQLPFHEEAGHGRPQQARHRLGGGVGPVRRAERIVHVEVAERRERRREVGIVRLLAGPEPRVLDECHPAPWEPPGGRDPGRRIRNELDRRAQDAFHVAHDLLERYRWIRLLGSSEVRQQHDARPLVAQVRDGGDRGADARVVRDRAVLERHVEVHANECPLAVQGGGRQIPEAALSHLVARCTSRSTQRAE